MNSFLTTKPSRWGPLLWRYLASWWYLTHLGAIAIVMAFSPSTYNRRNRIATSHYIYTSTWQVLPWFTLLSALVSLVIIRIVVVTARSYGLSAYALEMVVRVLVLELIPLTAAMFVALRAGLAFNAGDALAVAAAASPDRSREAQNRLRADLVPQVISNAFAVLSLAMVSSVIVLVLAYISVYGGSPWGLVDYTRTVGRIFDPVVTTGFALKTILFGLAVAVIPTAAILETHRTGLRPTSTVQPGAVRLLFVLLVIEAASLAVKYI
ncbi:ABC transporter permease [Massilia sp. CF038]|uniref:MlaE family ABC transporter permease n=1 Tax=Massilia sp. CF038 TaxID=1881045 RepID=UPI000920F6E5|nr:ABC transporter permease [Massilia sp. CF038]SHG68887.1 phospholipid/cholesterol/gamma-HCH transport system permease protein [Massilia sp. CF038]